MIVGLKLNDELPNIFSGTRYYGILSNISQINTFIGVNNSGKSRLLRTLFSDTQHIKFIETITTSKLTNLTNSYKPIFDSIQNLKAYQIVYKYEDHIKDLKNSIETGKSNKLKSILDLYWYTSTFEENEFSIPNPAFKAQLDQFLKIAKTYVDRFGSHINNIGSASNKFDRIYIPILRGLRPIAEEEDNFVTKNIYLNRTKHDYFKDNIPNGTIFTGLSIYEKVKRLLLGDESERNEIKLFEEFLEAHLFKKKINLIPKYDDDVLHIKIGNQTQFPIYKLGDGLQTLIIILFPLFLNRKQRHLIFIEEPETHLHPKWQRLLYRAMIIFDNHTYFLSTHSSVFVNSKNNSIFIISKQKDKTHIHYSDVKTEKIGILKDLGYRPNDLYQTNYLLWVEGPSDKLYLNYLITKTDSSLIEGEDYSIMYYGGSSYKHFLENKGELNLEFIQSLNQNYGLIMDSDRSKPRERYKTQKKEIVSLFKKNKAFCWLTKLREIENYIPNTVFTNAVKSVHKVKNIKINLHPFGDRCKYEDLDAKENFKPRIKLSNEIFSKIQKNKDGTTKHISSSELRSEIEASIKNTKRTISQIDKIKVAEKIVKDGFELENDELAKIVTALVKDIKAANV